MKTTKKQIKVILRTLDSTKIFQIAKLSGVDVSNKANVYKFILEYAPTKKVEKQAYNLSYLAGSFKNLRICYKNLNLPIAKAVEYAKYQIETKVSDNYFKPLVEGNTNIYWGQHDDYNKCIAMPNLSKYRKVANLINSQFAKNRNND